MRLLTVGHGTATAEELSSRLTGAGVELPVDAAALLHDVAVLHLMPDGRLTPHQPTEGVRVEGAALVYDVVP